MNIIKIVIDGGWVIRESEFSQIIDFIKFIPSQEAHWSIEASKRVRSEEDCNFFAFFSKVVTDF